MCYRCIDVRGIPLGLEIRLDPATCGAVAQFGSWYADGNVPLDDEWEVSADQVLQTTKGGKKMYNIGICVHKKKCVAVTTGKSPKDFVKNGVGA